MAIERVDVPRRIVSAGSPKGEPSAESTRFGGGERANTAGPPVGLLAQNEEHAVPLAFPVEWDAGAPEPHLLVNDYRALLIFRIRQSWDGTSAQMPDTTEAESFALVEFKRCRAAKLGSPNDEVLRGHPLFGRGLEAYAAQVVNGSRWLAELMRINSVHSGYRPEQWDAANHYVFWFHDSTFECIADGFEVEVREAALAEMLAEACRRMMR